MKIQELNAQIRKKKIRFSKDLKDLKPEDLLIFWVDGNMEDLEEFANVLERSGIPCKFIVLPYSVKIAKFVGIDEYLFSKIIKLCKRLLRGE